MRGELSFSRTPFFHTHRHIYSIHTYTHTHTHSKDIHVYIHNKTYNYIMYIFTIKTNTHTILLRPKPSL